MQDGVNSDKIAVVGLPDTAVKESKDRVTSAISNSALRWPSGKIAAKTSTYLITSRLRRSLDWASGWRRCPSNSGS